MGDRPEPTPVVCDHADECDRDCCHKEAHAPMQTYDEHEDCTAPIACEDWAAVRCVPGEAEGDDQ